MTPTRRNSLTRPNSVDTTYGYDPVSRLTSVLHKLGTATLDGAAYTYDNAGNRLTKVDERTTTQFNYTYDNIYQLAKVTQGTRKPPTVESYTYDLVGNRLTSLNVSPYDYNTSNELTSTPSGSYTYDNNGNRKTDPTGAQYTWDYENRLTQVVLPGTGGTVNFKYDPFGRRVQKAFTQNSTTTTTDYLYDGVNILETLNQSGSALARYTDSLSIDEPLSELISGTTSYYEQDGLGSVSSLSNSSGALANTYTYDSYGKLTGSTGTLSNPFQYTGREFDPETGVYEYRARYYDQNVGRFVSEDPIGLNAGLNMYEYADNSVPNAVDPLGFATCVYSITGGTLKCTPDDPSHQPVNIPVASGNNGDPQHHCKNNPQCTEMADTGPIPLGSWTWTNQSTSKPNGRVLTPMPGTDTFDRDLFRTHSCANPFGPSLQPPFCSGGCITGFPADIKKLNKLIDAEPGSTVEVVQ
jgi:RHS repeat-associated protein